MESADLLTAREVAQLLRYGARVGDGYANNLVNAAKAIIITYAGEGFVGPKGAASTGQSYQSRLLRFMGKRSVELARHLGTILSQVGDRGVDPHDVEAMLGP